MLTLTVADLPRPNHQTDPFFPVVSCARAKPLRAFLLTERQQPPNLNRFPFLAWGVGEGFDQRVDYVVLKHHHFPMGHSQMRPKAFSFP